MKFIRGTIRRCVCMEGSKTDLFDSRTSMEIVDIKEDKNYIFIRITEYGLYGTSEQYVLNTTLKKCVIKTRHEKGSDFPEPCLIFRYDRTLYTIILNYVL